MGIQSRELWLNLYYGEFIEAADRKSQIGSNSDVAKIRPVELVMALSLLVVSEVHPSQVKKIATPTHPHEKYAVHNVRSRPYYIQYTYVHLLLQQHQLPP